MSAMKIGAVGWKTYFTEGCKWISVCTFHIYCQICFENQYTRHA